MGQEYPSPRKALLGNDHVANLWCGVKYIFWHTMYALLALGILLARGLRAIGLPKAADKAHAAMTGDTAQTVSKYVVGALALGIVVAAVGIVLYALHTIPYLGTALIDVIAGLAVLLYVDDKTGYVTAFFDVLLVDIPHAVGKRGRRVGSVFASGAGTAGDTVAKGGKTVVEKTPDNVKERVYGYCPVSFDIEPKWFEKLT